MSSFLRRALLSAMCLYSATLCLSVATSVPDSGDRATACYWDPLPTLPVNEEVKTVPWDTARGAGGCCSSLDEVRSRIDSVDERLLAILAERASYVREAARFKPTRNVLDVPSRNAEVIERAVAGAPGVHLPQVVARAIFTSIINSSVAFEECVFDAYAGEA